MPVRPPADAMFAALSAGARDTTRVKRRAEPHQIVENKRSLPTNPSVYPNLMPEVLAAELSDAHSVGLSPVTCPGDEFDILVSAEPRLVYVVTTQRTLVVGPPIYRGLDVRHSVLADGQGVLAAGEVALIDLGHGLMHVLELTHRSGHYQPDINCLHVVADILRDLGFDVPPDLLPTYSGS